jgi:hypothetical protein
MISSHSYIVMEYDVKSFLHPDGGYLQVIVTLDENDGSEGQREGAALF